jgi:hypothetical protein
MSDKNNSLELYIAEKLKPLDSNARPSKASGASTEILDIYNNIIYFECKIKRTHENIIVDYKKEYLKSLNEIPINTEKPFAIATENKYGKKFITMEADEFFEILYKAYENE